MYRPLENSQLLCRFVAIETRMTLQPDAHGQPITKYTTPYRTDFGSRLLDQHIVAFAGVSSDGPPAQKALKDCRGRPSRRKRVARLAPGGAAGDVAEIDVAAAAKPSGQTEQGRPRGRVEVAGAAARAGVVACLCDHVAEPLRRPVWAQCSRHLRIPAVPAVTALHGERMDRLT
jgi:hypothetical protein